MNGRKPVRVTKVHIKGYRKFKELVFEPNHGVNILVGGNDAGKSTLLEAIVMALTGRVGRTRAAEELSPHWFNKKCVSEFFETLNSGPPFKYPEFRIDLYLESDDKGLQGMRGIYNLANEDSIGLSIYARPDEEYLDELAAYFSAEITSEILPVEYYKLEWRDFSDATVFKIPKGVRASVIDSNTTTSRNGLDFHTRRLLDMQIDDRAKATISVEHRKLRSELGQKELEQINAQLVDEAGNEADHHLTIQVDQSRAAAWDSTLVPGIEDLPLALAGQGAQVVAKTMLALSHVTEKQGCILIEEPENHLSHTRLWKLLNLIDQRAKGEQTFITTHSSYVMNRIGLDKLAMISEGQISKFQNLSKGTVRFFRKRSGFDTLRLLLADQVVAVEGPSDDIVFNRFFKDKYGTEPLDNGIDVLSASGVGFPRLLELAAMLNTRLACIRDNDGLPKEHWQAHNAVKEFLEPGMRELFIGDCNDGRTLEPQILSANSTKKLREVLKLGESKDPLKWMSEDRNKTEAAIRIADSDKQLVPPAYFIDAMSFVMRAKAD